MFIFADIFRFIINNLFIKVSHVICVVGFIISGVTKVLKFDNDFQAFTEDRSWQIKTWNENQKYFLNFLKENKISRLYAYGSYFYLLFRVFNLKDLSFSLFISYIIYYPFFLSYKIIYLVKKIFKKK